MDSSDPTGTAQALAALARQLTSERDVASTLDAIVNSAVDTFDGVAAVGVSYVDGTTLLARAQSDQLVTQADDLQTAVQQGPCLATATAQSDLVRIDDMRTDNRFPDFCPGAVEIGVLSTLSFRLFVDNVTLGNLSLFASAANIFDSPSEAIGELFATHAAVALHGVRLEQQLQDAARSRDVIGQAKGVLMATHHIDEDTAFATLVRFSQSEHLKLHEVAVRLLKSLESERNRAGFDARDPG